MDYKTVMVSLALDRPNGACLAVAGDIAERFGARVIGVAASDIRPTLYFAEGDFARKLLDEEASAIRKRLSELEAEFRGAVEKRATSVEWRSAQALSGLYLLQQARAADLIVVGARGEAIVDLGIAADPGDLLMQAGRPVVPPTAQWLDLRSVLVAWKDVREARRAVFDALPLLAAAKDVTSRRSPKSKAIGRTYWLKSPMSRHGCVATASLRARWFPKKSPARSSNSTRRPPTSTPAW
jgi:hypothetical protein